MTLKAYLNRFRSVKHSNCAMSWSGTFRWYCSQSCVYSDKTTWCLWWKIPLENPWKGDFRDSAFQNVPRCLGPKKLVASLFWCEFQSRLLFIVSLKGGWRMVPRKMWVSENFGPISKSQERFLRVSKSRFRVFFFAPRRLDFFIDFFVWSSEVEFFRVQGYTLWK